MTEAVSIFIEKEIVMKNQAQAISDDYLKKIFRKAPNPIVISKAEDGTYVDVNESFMKLYGVRKQDVIGKSSVGLGFISKEERSELLQEIKEKGYAENILIKNRTKAGTLQCLLLNTTPIRVKNQMLFHTIGTNISKVRQDLETRREKIFLKLLDSLDSTGVVIFNHLENKKLFLFYVNELAKRILEKEKISDLINVLDTNGSVFLKYKATYYHVKKLSTSRNTPMKIIVMEKFSGAKSANEHVKQRVLTPRQQEIAFLVATGHSNDEIADKLQITKHTVKDHLKKIFRIYDVHNRVELCPKILSWR